MSLILGFFKLLMTGGCWVAGSLLQHRSGGGPLAAQEDTCVVQSLGAVNLLTESVTGVRCKG